MGFKTLTSFKEEKKGNFFTLVDDGDYADVIFLYRDVSDVLIADVHYIKSNEYNGYAHCCGDGCPACAYGKNGIRIDSKLFIPLYNLETQQIEFFDRSSRFEYQLNRDVLSRYPNPSEYVFRITRHGEHNSRDTRYSIEARGKNSSLPYDAILAKFNIQLPDYYSTVVRELSIQDMSRMLSASGSSSIPTSEYDFGAVPRDAFVPPADVIPEPITVQAPAVTVPEPLNDAMNVPDTDDSADDLGDVSF